MSKANRTVSINTPLGDKALIFRRFTGSEEMARLFEYEVELLRVQEDGPVDANQLLGKGMTLKLATVSGAERCFNGVVTEFKHTGLVSRYATYRAVLRPWLWLLSLSVDCRIFQQKTVIEIVSAVFDEYNFADYKFETSTSYETIAYCVQYRESDFNFISRLLEENGLYYYFVHNENQHQLVIIDTNSSYQNVSGYTKIPYFPVENAESRERDHISEWVSEHRVCSGKFELNDYDFEKPEVDLTTKSANVGKYAEDDFEVFDYPGRYSETTVGSQMTDRLVEESLTAYAVIQGSGNAQGIQPGMEFQLQDFYFEDQNSKHYIVYSHYVIEGDQQVSGMVGAEVVFQCDFTAISSKQQFRPVQLSKKPLIPGTQTAKVVGKTGEEIWTDKYGRVKVQFHWDREGKDDENSTCWIRVSQPMAGKNWGWISLPRIGQEVVVSFLEGDPDRPLITGRVYNADQMPPYELPKDQTQSGIKTRSTKAGTAENFNEIRFEDKKDQEELYVHAEKDYQRVVENNETVKIGFDKKDSGDQSVEIYNHRTITLDQGNDKLTVKKGNHSINIAMGKSTIEAKQSIELKVGANSIKIDQKGITIKGIMIKVQGSAMIEETAPIIKIN